MDILWLIVSRQVLGGDLLCVSFVYSIHKGRNTIQLQYATTGLLLRIALGFVSMIEHILHHQGTRRDVPRAVSRRSSIHLVVMPQAASRWGLD